MSETTNDSSSSDVVELRSLREQIDRLDQRINDSRTAFLSIFGAGGFVLGVLAFISNSNLNSEREAVRQYTAKSEEEIRQYIDKSDKGIRQLDELGKTLKEATDERFRAFREEINVRLTGADHTPAELELLTSDKEDLEGATLPLEVFKRDGQTMGRLGIALGNKGELPTGAMYSKLYADEGLTLLNPCVDREGFATETTLDFVEVKDGLPGRFRKYWSFRFTLKSDPEAGTYRVHLRYWYANGSTTGATFRVQVSKP